MSPDSARIHRMAVISAVHDDPGRTAMCISLILHGVKHAESRLPSVLLHLRQLEDECQVVSATDTQGVVRWHTATPEDSTHGPSLGAEQFTKGCFTPTQPQRRTLGL